MASREHIYIIQFIYKTPIACYRSVLSNKSSRRRSFPNMNIDGNEGEDLLTKNNGIVEILLM